MAVSGQTFFQSQPTTTFDDADRLVIQQNNLTREQSNALAIERLRAQNRLAIEGGFDQRNVAAQQALAAQLAGQSDIARIGNEPALGVLGLQNRQFDADQNTLQNQVQQAITPQVLQMLQGINGGGQPVFTQGGKQGTGIGVDGLLQQGSQPSLSIRDLLQFSSTGQLPALPTYMEKVADAQALRQLSAINQLSQGGDRTFREEQKLEGQASGQFGAIPLPGSQQAGNRLSEFNTKLRSFIDRDSDLIGSDPDDTEVKDLADDFKAISQALVDQGEVETVEDAKRMLREVIVQAKNDPTTGTELLGSEDQLQKLFELIGIK